MSRLPLPLAFGAAAVAAAIHAAQVGPHAAQGMPLMAAGFAVSVLYGFGWVAATAAAPTRRPLLAAGAASHLAMLVIGGMSRTVGLPTEGVEPVTGPWGAAMVAEGIVVACCVLLLAGRRAVVVGRQPVAAGEQRREET